MKKYCEFDVELVDLESFEELPGAEVFTQEFSDFAISRLRFRFIESRDIQQAKNRLTELNLKYKEYRGIELDSDEELENYPIVVLAFNALDADSKEQQIHYPDIYTDLKRKTLNVSTSGKKFLSHCIPNLSFSASSNKTHYTVENIACMENPDVVDKQLKKIEKAHMAGKDYYIVTETDGLMQFNQKSVQELANSNFKKMTSFFYEGEFLETPFTRYVSTGLFALKLKKFLDSNQSISIIIPDIYN